MSDADDIIKKFLQTAKAMEEMQSASVKEMGGWAKERMLRAAVASAGPDRKFSNLNKAKAVLDVKMHVRTLTDAETEAVVEAKGPWGISDSDYDSYVITAKLGKITGKGAKRARRQRDLDIAFGARGAFAGVKPMGSRGKFGPRFKVTHPAVKSRGNWEAGKNDAYTFISKSMQKQGIREFRQIWSR